jgi:hypothetical protein
MTPWLKVLHPAQPSTDELRCAVERIGCFLCVGGKMFFVPTSCIQLSPPVVFCALLVRCLWEDGCAF